MSSILSWNVRGLGDPIKRQAVFSYLDQYTTTLLYLQETHLFKEIVGSLKKFKYPTQFHSWHTTHSRGVSVLVSGTAPFYCRCARTDPGQRCVFIYCTLFGLHCVVAVNTFPPHSGGATRASEVLGAPFGDTGLGDEQLQRSPQPHPQSV